MQKLYIIAGPNGAGKTTASYTVLPEILEVKEFVNADEIARGLSPFQPETVAIEAGKIMLRRLQNLLLLQQDFAFETTLSTRSFAGFIQRAKEAGYKVSLIFYWLSSADLAIQRVKKRVRSGGHNVPEETIRRRYKNGLTNFLHLYKDIVDYRVIVDNSFTEREIIASKNNNKIVTYNQEKWNTIQTIILT